jgi:hypothetical protein
VALFQYSDLLADLPRQLRRLADGLSIDVTGERIEQFAAAAAFDRMKERADELAPDVGIMDAHRLRPRRVGTEPIKTVRPCT